MTMMSRAPTPTDLAAETCKQLRQDTRSILSLRRERLQQAWKDLWKTTTTVRVDNNKSPRPGESPLLLPPRNSIDHVAKIPSTPLQTQPEFLIFYIPGITAPSKWVEIYRTPSEKDSIQNSPTTPPISNTNSKGLTARIYEDLSDELRVQCSREGRLSPFLTNRDHWKSPITQDKMDAKNYVNQPVPRPTTPSPATTIPIYQRQLKTPSRSTTPSNERVPRPTTQSPATTLSIYEEQLKTLSRSTTPSNERVPRPITPSPATTLSLYEQQLKTPSRSTTPSNERVPRPVTPSPATTLSIYEQQLKTPTTPSNDNSDNYNNHDNNEASLSSSLLTTEDIRSRVMMSSTQSSWEVQRASGDDYEMVDKDDTTTSTSYRSSVGSTVSTTTISVASNNSGASPPQSRSRRKHVISENLRAGQELMDAVKRLSSRTLDEEDEDDDEDEEEEEDGVACDSLQQFIDLESKRIASDPEEVPPSATEASTSIRSRRDFSNASTYSRRSSVISDSHYDAISPILRSSSSASSRRAGASSPSLTKKKSFRRRDEVEGSSHSRRSSSAAHRADSASHHSRTSTTAAAAHPPRDPSSHSRRSTSHHARKNNHSTHSRRRKSSHRNRSVNDHLLLDKAAAVKQRRCDTPNSLPARLRNSNSKSCLTQESQDSLRSSLLSISSMLSSRDDGSKKKGSRRSSLPSGLLLTSRDPLNWNLQDEELPQSSSFQTLTSPKRLRSLSRASNSSNNNRNSPFLFQPKESINNKGNNNSDTKTKPAERGMSPSFVLTSAAAAIGRSLLLSPTSNSKHQKKFRDQ